MTLTAQGCYLSAVQKLTPARWCPFPVLQAMYQMLDEGFIGLIFSVFNSAPSKEQTIQVTQLRRHKIAMLLTLGCISETQPATSDSLS
jgi:accessory gene regulator protein AgrB